MNIYDEKKYAEELLNNLNSDRIITFRDILILSKYFRYIGLKERVVEERVFNFLKEKVDGFNEDVSYKKVTRAIRKGKKMKLRILDDVPITKNEIEKIREVKNFRYEKLLFYLLVIAKFNRITNISEKKGDSKNYFVNNKIAEHLKKARIAQKPGEVIFNELHLAGYMDVVEKYNTLVLKYSSTDDVSETYILVTNMNDIMSFYLPYCILCGKNLEKKGNNHKMCSGCYEEKRRRDNLKNTKNYRERLSAV